MKIVARERVWSMACIFTVTAVAITLATSQSAWAQEPDDEPAPAASGMGAGMMMPGGPPADHLAQVGGRSGRMGGMGGMGMGMGGGGGMGMEGGMGMGMGPGMEGGMGFGPGMMGSTPSAKQLAELPLNDVLAIVLASKPSDKDLPEIEKLVERAKAIDPQVIAAQAALQRAQAELQRIELDVVRRVIETRARWKVSRQAVERLQAKVNQDPEKEELTRAYIAARAELAMIERTLPLLADSTGIAGRKGTGAVYGVGVNSDAGLVGVITTKVEAITTADGAIMPPKELDVRVPFEFIETPLDQVVAQLQEASGVQFLLDRETSVGDLEVTVQLKDVPLKDGLQAIEDTCYPVRFVIRPYGVLVTDAETAANRFGQKVEPLRRMGGSGAYGRAGSVAVPTSVPKGAVFARPPGVPATPNPAVVPPLRSSTGSAPVTSPPVPSTGKK